ncbi:MAG: potassium/proton antiporter [Mycobacteriales bacterium]|nr:potassium/proton antiporter [Mycobacteriales bacterium]
MDGELNLVLLGSCLLLLVAVLAVRVSARTGLPVLLLYLGIGVAVGEAGLGVQFEDYQLTADLGLLALAVILAEGGLTTKVSHIRPVFGFAVVLSTLGVLASVAVIAGLTVLLLDVDLRTAVILGAVVSSTDAATVFSVLRKLPVKGRLRATLEAESGLNDAPVIVLVSLAASDEWGRTGVLESAALIGYELAAGAALGVLVGIVGAWILARLALPTAGLYPIATLALTLIAFTSAQALHASGFLAVYLCGLVLGSAHLPHRRAVIGFVSSAALLAELGLFTLLGLLASPARLPEALVDALVVGAAATFVARPLAVWLSALGFRLPWREQAFLSWAGLRGAVPIVIAIIPVTEGLAGAERVVDVVFVLVVVYTLVQAPSIPRVGRLLGVIDRGGASELDVELTPMDNLAADLLQVTVESDSQLRGVYVRELRLPVGARVVLVERAGASVPLDEHSQLLAGDHVLVVTPTVSREATERRIRAVNKGGKLARWYGREPLADDRAIPLRVSRAARGRVPEGAPRQLGPR